MKKTLNDAAGCGDDEGEGKGDRLSVRKHTFGQNRLDCLHLDIYGNTPLLLMFSSPSVFQSVSSRPGTTAGSCLIVFLLVIVLYHYYNVYLVMRE